MYRGTRLLYSWFERRIPAYLLAGSSFFSRQSTTIADRKQHGVINENKAFAWQQPNILKRFEDGYIIREMSYEDTRFVNK